MLRFLGMLVLLTTSFTLGFYIGRHSIGELTKTVTDLSRNVVDTTLSFERNLRGRQELVDAKAQVIQAKSDVLDRNFGNAAKALGEAADDLERLTQTEPATDRRARLTSLIAKTRASQQELASGKTVPRARFDEIQKELDALAERGK